MSLNNWYGDDHIDEPILIKKRGRPKMDEEFFYDPNAPQIFWGTVMVNVRVRVRNSNNVPIKVFIDGVEIK